MAREAHEREDLLRDARALVPRIMLRVELAGGMADVLAGFRGEALSLYFGDDPVFHFNARGELRRAFVDDRLIKAERGQLVILTPQRTDDRTEFQATLFGMDAQSSFLAEVKSRLRDLDAALSANRFVIIGQEPSDGDALNPLRRWLAERSEIRVANSPRVDGN
jgi:hypothetical protein